MDKLCPNCHYLGRGKKSFLYTMFYGNIYFGIILIIGGIFNLSYRSDLLGSQTILTAYSSILIFVGVICIVNYYLGTKTCPKCGNKEMLPLDNPEAINLIKKYDLKVGENPSPNIQNEPSSSSLETPKL